MESFALLTANQDLNAVSVSPRTVTFNRPFWNYLVSASEVICLTDPNLPPAEGDPAETAHSVSNFLFLPPSGYKSLPFGMAPFLSVRWDAVQLMNH